MDPLDSREAWLSCFSMPAACFSRELEKKGSGLILAAVHGLTAALAESGGIA